MQKGSIEERVMAGLRRLGYPFLDQLPSIDHILAPGKLRYQLLEWLFLQYDDSLQTAEPPSASKPGTALEPSQLDRLTFWASLLGLYFDPTKEGSGDRGDRQKHLQLFEELIDIVELTARDENIDEVLAKDIKLAHGIALMSKEAFSPHFSDLPEDMRFSTGKEDKINWAEVERECVEKEAMIAELCPQLQSMLQACPQSEQRITHTELAALHQRLRALSESADRFYSTHSAEFKTWIVKNSQSKDMLTFQENSRLLGDRFASISVRHKQVHQMLEDFQNIKRCIDTATNLQQEAAFMEDRDSEYLLRAERLRQLRDQIIVFDQATNRPDDTHATVEAST